MSKGDTARTLGVKLALLRNTIRNTYSPMLLQKLRREEAALARQREIAKKNEATDAS